ADNRRKAYRLSKSAEAGPIRLALNVEDKALADRLAALLANVPGLRLVRGNESADVALVLPTITGSVSADGDVRRSLGAARPDRGDRAVAQHQSGGLDPRRACACGQHHG